MTTASRSPGFTTSRSGGAPIGRCTAARNAACSSGSPGTKRGSMTVTLRPGISAARPSRPYCRCTFMRATRYDAGDGGSTAGADLAVSP